MKLVLGTQSIEPTRWSWAPLNQRGFLLELSCFRGLASEGSFRFTTFSFRFASHWLQVGGISWFIHFRYDELDASGKTPLVGFSLLT